MNAPLRSRNRLVMVAIATLFALPILLAFAIEQGYLGDRPQGGRNYGALISPAQRLPDKSAVRSADGQHWTIWYRTAEPCAAPCLERLSLLTRLRQATGKEAGRVRLLISGRLTPSAKAAVPAAEWLVTTDAADALLPDIDTALIVDPRGYASLRYGPGFDMNGLRKDLMLLLRWIPRASAESEALPVTPSQP